MASLVIFHHQPIKNLAHRLDPRIKLLVMIILASSGLFTQPRGLAVLFIALIIASTAAKVYLRPLLKNGLPIWIVATILFLSRAAGTPGNPVIEVFGAVITREGIRSGALAAGRLIFLVFVSHSFISLTSLTDIQRGLNSLLSPLPFPAGPRTALLTGLSINLVPGLLDTAGEILDAAACRGLVFRRHPYKTLLLFTPLFIRKTVRRAAETAEALEARNYRYDRAWKPLSVTWRDLLVLAGALLTAGGAFIL
jgi:energy-coupling factor transporter transmembrane protein EcfT